MGATAKRIVFRVRFSPKSRFWGVTSKGADLSFFSTRKSEAVREGAKLARDIRESEGTPTQLVAHSKRGRICFERTYGGDPRRRKG